MPPGMLFLVFSLIMKVDSLLVLQGRKFLYSQAIRCFSECENTCRLHTLKKSTASK